MPPPPLPRRGCPEEEEEAEADAKTETETETLAELEAELREDAAVTVQAHWRGHRGRGEALNMLDSEIAALERTGRSPEGTVQQQDRDSHRESESETEKELEALEAELREDAAVTLQANWRGSMARRSCEQQIMQYLADADAIFWEHVKDEVSPRPEERADPSPTEPPSQPPAAQTRRQRKPLATPNRSTKAHVAHVEPAKPPPVSPLPLNEEDAALRIQCRVRGNAERASVDREQLGASEWCGQFFDAVDVDEHGLIGKAELILVSEAFGDNVHKARARASEILAAAPPSMATAAGLVDRGTFVSYWVGVTRDLQSRRGSYSVAHVLTLRDQLSSLEEKLFEAARFVDADLCQQPGAEDEYTAAAIRVQTAARGYAGRKELNRLRDAREAAAEAQRVEKAEREASKAAARAARVAAAEQRQREAAATLVQSHARGFMGRRRQETCTSAAVAIQSCERGRQQRALCSKPRAERQRAALALQSARRGQIARRRVNEAKQTTAAASKPGGAESGAGHAGTNTNASLGVSLTVSTDPAAGTSNAAHSPQPPADQSARDKAATRRQRKPLATPNRSTKAHVAHVEPAKPPPVSPLPLNEEDAALRIQCRVRGNAEEQQQKAAEEKAAAEAAATKRAAEEQKAVEEQEQKAAEEKAVVEAAAAKRAAEEQEQDQKAAEEKAPTIQKCTEADEAAAAAGLKLDPEPELEPEPELKPQMDQLQKQEQATAAIDLNAGGGDEAGVFHVHYTSANGQCEQPVTMRELALKLAHSDVDWQTLVWSPGMAHWAPLEECLGHEAWADQLEDYLQLAIEQASQDDDTELVVGAVEPQPVGTTTVAAEPEMQQPQDEQQAEGTHNATKESTTAVTLELLWT